MAGLTRPSYMDEFSSAVRVTEGGKLGYHFSLNIAKPGFGRVRGRGGSGRLLSRYTLHMASLASPRRASVGAHWLVQYLVRDCGGENCNDRQVRQRPSTSRMELLNQCGRCRSQRCSSNNPSLDLADKQTAGTGDGGVSDWNWGSNREMSKFETGQASAPVTPVGILQLHIVECSFRSVDQDPGIGGYSVPVLAYQQYPGLQAQPRCDPIT